VFRVWNWGFSGFVAAQIYVVNVEVLGFRVEGSSSWIVAEGHLDVPVRAVLSHAHAAQEVLAHRDVALDDLVGKWTILVGALPVQEQHLADGNPGRVV